MRPVLGGAQWFDSTIRDKPYGGSVKYVIQKGGDRLPLFFGVDGWHGNSHFATKYDTEQDAREVIHVMEMDNDGLVKIVAVID